MKNLLLILVGFLQFGLLFAQQRPLVTERAEIVEKGHVLFDLGFDYLEDAKFRLSGLRGNLFRVGVVGARWGVGERVEVQAQWVVQDILNIEARSPAPFSDRLNFSGNTTHDVGDLVLGTKLLLAKEEGNRPAIGFRFGMQLPNAENESGLGNDETDAFGSFILEKGIGKGRIIGNLGVAILGDPVTPAAQDDLYTYGLAVIYPIQPSVNLVADAYGRVGAGGIGTEERSRLRLGAQVKERGWYFDGAAIIGLRQTDPDWGLTVGVTRTIGL